MIKKSSLSILLSKLAVFSRPKSELEQYPTDSENASFILWHAYMLHDIENKVVADLGCGTGILGLGALLLGAKKCFFVDKSQEDIDKARQNLTALEQETGIKLKSRAVFIVQDIEKFAKKVDTAIQNPPFNNDRVFLEKALEIAQVSWSMHNLSTLDFLKKFMEKRGKLTNIFKIQLELKKTMPWHKQENKRIEVACLRVQRFSKILFSEPRKVATFRKV